ncbi:MAG: DNA repair protein RadC [Rikenellaceae bacterium]
MRTVAHDKLISRGAEALSNVELLSIILDDDDLQLSQHLLDRYAGSLSHIGTEEISRLRMYEGLGLKRASRILAAAEWGRRTVIASAANQVTISSSQDVVNIFRPLLETLKHEECWVLYLNTANGVIEQQRVSQGGITTTVVDHRLIVKRALELLATRIVIIHNHPSGLSDPSLEDRELTQKIKSAAALFDITLLDHIIIASSGEYSFKSGGLL